MALTYVLIDNACVLLNNAGEIRGSRIFGPVARELRATNMKLCHSLLKYFNIVKDLSNE